MKILLCNNTLSLMAGSETALFSMAVELKRLGHEVTAFSFNLGEVSKRLEALGIECLDNLSGLRNQFDIAICNHYEPTNYIKATLPEVRIIFTLHGIIGGPETPPLYADHFVAVSEETKEVLSHKYGVNDKNLSIIRNGVDMDRFKPKRARSKKIEKALISSSYISQESELYHKIWDACRIKNIELHCIGRNFSWVWETENVYDMVDIVFTLGRGCLEAMSCNRPVIVLGHWGKNQQLSADGMVTKDTIGKIRQNNFSSRALRKEWGVRDIVEEMSKYDNTTDFRELVKKDHDIKKTTQKYLEIAKKII